MDLLSTLEAGAPDNQRDVNGTLVRTSLVFRVAGSEMAGVITKKDNQGVVREVLLPQGGEDRPYRVVDGRHAAVIVGE